MVDVSVQSFGIILWIVIAYKLFGPKKVIRLRLPSIKHIEKFAMAIISIVFTGIQKLVFVLKLIVLLAYLPGKSVDFVKQFRRTWELADEDKVALPKPGKKQKYILTQKGKYTYTDKQLSKLVAEGLEMSQRAYPYAMHNGIVQLQSKQYNSISRIQGGRWVTHGGSVLVEARRNGNRHNRRQAQDEVNNFFDNAAEYEQWLSDVEQNNEQ